MLTKERTSKTRKLKYAAVALALLAVLVFCFASCGKATPTGIEYVENTATKLVYNLGETFDCAGAQVKVTYANGAEETVAVTPEMVGTAPLTFGMESVTVTYSENGATVVGHIPVTVVDPNAALKTDTIAALAANEKYVANKNDGGAVLLLGDYSAKIKAAASKDAITALVSNFEADLDDYIAKKEAIVAKFGDEALVKKIAQLYAQYKKDIDTAEANAKANVEAASTLAEAENYYLQFVIAVDNKLAEQKLIEDKEGGNKGQIYDKIELLYQLEDYLDDVMFYENLVHSAYNNGETLGFFTDTAEKTAAEQAEEFYYNTLKEYDDIRKTIDYQHKYITLAIDLSAVKLEEVIGKPLLTEVDTAVSDFLIKGITVLPTAYKEDGTLDTENDSIAKLLADVKALLTEAEKKFGATGVEELKAKYGTDGTEDYIDLLIADITMKYNTLNTIREDAETVVALIDAIANYQPTGATPPDANTPADDHDKAIRDAWAALKTWNAKYNDALLTTSGEGETIISVDCNKECDEVVYTATGYDAANKKFNNITETWSKYKFDKDYVVKYFIPNIDELIAASQDRFAERVKVAIDNDKLTEGNIVYSATPAVNSGEEIETARGLYDAFKGAYTEDVYNALIKAADGSDPYLARLEKAEEDFGDLEAKAKAANSAITVYKEMIGDNVGTVELEHFAPAQKEAFAPLKDAYDKYLAFAKANGAIENADNAAYTDVITEEARLIAYMEQYTELLAYGYAKNVDSALTINEAFATRAKDNASDIPFCEAVQKFAEDMIIYIKNNYPYTRPATVMVKEQSVAVDDYNEKFYLVEILNYNKNIVKEAAEDVADYIENEENGIEKFDLTVPENNPLA